ncbi:MAG: DUF853 domain-containing protein [Lachnospiraceae bacterium]|nr:DUF853 domain-containing protein [Lachnospiraceae bacterium]
MLQDMKILVGKANDKNVYIYPQMANRHGLIAGATGTGKTVTLKVLAESFSDCGVPVFFADVKGDLSGMCKKGENSENVSKRVESMGLDALGFDFREYPVTYWDVYEEKGLPLRTTITEMGPLLMSRIMGLNETQTGIMTLIFKIADDEGLLLIDTKDLRSMIQYVGENAKEYTLKYGNITTQSLGAISRALVGLEAEGGDKFFGEPALNITDWFSTDMSGKGYIQILDCQKLINNPTMYATFLLWMMSELFETLPEMGDLEKPKMVFFFDEAHMLFDNAPASLLSKIEQVVKLIRSKGVGIYFVTQNPKDIPDGVMSQLGNKVQHALHAYTPNEQKAAKAAAGSYRENPEFDTYETMLALGTGEALVSVLDEKGIPTVVEKCKILPPQSYMGAIDDATRDSKIKGHVLYTKYSQYEDRDSAYEFLTRRNLEIEQAKQEELDAAAQAKEEAALMKEQEKKEAQAQKAKEREENAKKRATKTAAKSVANSVAGTVGREVGKTVGKVGGKFGKTLGGNLGASLARGIIGTLFK